MNQPPSPAVTPRPAQPCEPADGTGEPEARAAREPAADGARYPEACATCDSAAGGARLTSDRPRASAQRPASSGIQRVAPEEEMKRLLAFLTKNEASDLHLKVGYSPHVRIGGHLAQTRIAAHSRHGLRPWDDPAACARKALE